MQTQLTNFIPAQVLEREGFVHVSDPAQMLAKLDKQYLANEGWVNASVLRCVNVSVRKAAEIIGCSASTLAEYIKMGYLRVVDNQVSLLEALTFDYKAAKADYLQKKKQ